MQIFVRTQQPQQKTAHKPPPTDQILKFLKKSTISTHKAGYQKNRFPRIIPLSIPLICLTYTINNSMIITYDCIKISQDVLKRKISNVSQDNTNIFLYYFTCDIRRIYSFKLPPHLLQSFILKIFETYLISAHDTQKEPKTQWVKKQLVIELFQSDLVQFNYQSLTFGGYPHPKKLVQEPINSITIFILTQYQLCQINSTITSKI
eukprot:TRINITY_DN3032_c1_g1_i3.p2 TRINITY_DN3032_c1_g1~~TRINITY_DN3032_c1_g1_i3.p2  ORF type:complete len:205 (+),score=-10.49 TRINITY_DN3032_c1_g1_i3:473-1087(+)